MGRVATIYICLGSPRLLEPPGRLPGAPEPPGTSWVLSPGLLGRLLGPGLSWPPIEDLGFNIGDRRSEVDEI